MQKITDEDVLVVLRAMTCTGDLAVLNSGQLDRKLYEKVNKVLVALGGKWNRGRGGHVFKSDADATLRSVYEDGTYRDAKKEDAFFETPEDLAHQLVKMANIHAGDLVLEPSAGHGNIVRAVEKAGARVEAIEINPEFEPKLWEAGAKKVLIADFLALPPRYLRYDAVVMNPPFSIGKKQTDTLHVMHAWEHLAPDGTLVAITSLGWTFRNDKQSTAFRAFVEEHGEYVKNPEGAFKASGTSTNTVTVTLRRAA